MIIHKIKGFDIYHNNNSMDEKSNFTPKCLRHNARKFPRKSMEQLKYIIPIQLAEQDFPNHVSLILRAVRMSSYGN